PHLREAVAVARSVGLHHRAGRCLFNLGALAWEQGGVDAADSLYEEAAVEMRATGDTFGLARVLHARANVLSWHGEQVAAVAMFEQACALKRQVGDVQGLASSEQSLALALRALGRVDEA